MLIRKMTIDDYDLISFIENEAGKGNTIFIQDIEEGHIEKYKKDIHYIETYWNNY